MLRVSQLNYECDHLTNHARTTYASHPLMPPTLHLPEEQYTLWIGPNKIYCNLNDNLLNQASLPIICPYYVQKYSWDDDLFDQISWTACGLAMSSVTPVTYAWLSKLSSGFVGLGNMLDKSSYWKSACCPRCSSHSENLERMLSCPQPVSRKKNTNGLANVHLWMLRSYIEVTLEDEIVRVTNHWVTDPTMHDFWSPCPPVMLQLQIGWIHFLLVRLHVLFANSQHDYFTRKGFTQGALSWTRRLIINIWCDIVRPQWQHGTSIVHALEKGTTQTRLHQESNRRGVHFLLFHPTAGPTLR